MNDFPDITRISQELAASLRPVIPVSVFFWQLDSKAATDADTRSIVCIAEPALRPSAPRDRDARRAAQHVEPLAAVMLRYPVAALRDVVATVVARALRSRRIPANGAQCCGVAVNVVSDQFQRQRAACLVAGGIIDDGKMKV